MIQEALAHVWQQAQEANRPTVFQLDTDPTHIHRIAHVDGHVEVVETPPEPRLLQVDRLADIINLANERHLLDRSPEADEDVLRRAIFYNPFEVTLVFNTANGREHARLPLNTTDEHMWFMQRITEPQQEPKELATALRLKLRRCYDDAKLIEQVSSLRSRAEGEAHKVHSRTSESWGKSVTEQIADEHTLPDPYQTFSVRRYRNPDLDVRHKVQFALDPDTNTLRWLVYPLEDSWIDYLEAAVELVGDRLRENITADVPIYRGTFNTE